MSKIIQSAKYSTPALPLLYVGFVALACSGGSNAPGPVAGGTGGDYLLTPSFGSGGSPRPRPDPDGSTGPQGQPKYVPTNGCAAPTFLVNENTKAMIMNFASDCGSGQKCFSAPDGLTAQTMPMSIELPAGCSGNAGSFAITTAPNAWNWAGTVTGPVGASIAFGTCIDAKEYNAIQIAMMNRGAAAVPFKVTLRLKETTPVAEGGLCSAADCTNPSIKASAPTGSNTATLSFDLFSGAVPTTSLAVVHQILGLRFELDWPCTGGTPYDVDLAFTTVKFQLAPRAL